MYVHRSASSVVVRAPAKLNLFFEVLARRSDGYHEIESLMVPLGLFDTLTACDEPTGELRLDGRWADPAPDADTLGELPAPEQNLVYRAVALLREQAGVDRGLKITLTKRIPSAAGLGGGSSDAAAALLAANQVWNLKLPLGKLAEIAAAIGSDVPFFLGQGAAVCRGRGERIDAEPGLAQLHVVVVRPPVGLGTAAVYRNCEVAAQPRSVEPLVAALKRGDARQLSSQIFNRLQTAAAELCPWIGRLERELADQDCLAHQMSGSGTSYFGICRHARHARRVAGRLRARGIGRVYAASTGLLTRGH